MSTLLEALKAGTNNRKTVKLVLVGGKEVTVALRLLSIQDISDANIAADRLYKTAELDVNFANVDNYHAEIETQTLFRSCLDPETGDPITSDITAFRNLLSVGIRNKLVRAYNEFHQEQNPGYETITDSEFDALVARVKKSPQEAISSVSCIATLQKLAIYLANVQPNSPEGSGSI